MSVFSDVWLYSAVAFVIGVLLTWLVWVWPLQKRLNRARADLVAADEVGTAAPDTLFRPGSGEQAPATARAGVGALGRGVDTAVGFSPDFDARPGGTTRQAEPVTSLLEPVAPDPWSSGDDDPGDDYAGDDYASSYSEYVYRDEDFEDDPDDEAPLTGDVPEPDREADAELVRAEGAQEQDDRAEGAEEQQYQRYGQYREESGQDDTDGRAAAYFAHLERERAGRETPDADPGDPAGGEDREAPEAGDAGRRGRFGDLFTPAGERYASGAEDAGWYTGDAAEEGGEYDLPARDLPSIPELPHVGGDDLTPFDPFSSEAEEAGFDTTANGTAQLEYLTATSGQAGEGLGNAEAEPPGGGAEPPDAAGETTVVGAGPVRDQDPDWDGGPGEEPARSLFEPVVAAEPLDEERDTEADAGADEHGAEAGPAVARQPDGAGDRDEQVPEGPFGSGSALPRVDGGAPSPDFTIKARTSSMVFHTPGSPFFERLLPQVWFRSQEDAERAGFTSWERPREDR